MGRASGWEAAEEKPVAVLGAGGMLATALVGALEEGDHHYVALSEHDLDITFEGRVVTILKSLNPRTVINAAAYTDVDGAQTHRDTAYAVNGAGAGHVAAAAALIGANVIHMSTDYVFDGEKDTPYLPGDNTGPVNIYGASKLEGERQVRKKNKDHLVVRTSWLYGPNGKNFVNTMLDLGRSRQSLKVVDDQKGCPTYTGHLAGGMIRLMNMGITGTYHLTNSGQCSWYEFAVQIFRLSDMSIEVNPVPTEAFPRPAPRPRNSVLDSTAAIELLGSPLPSWQEALGEFLG
jgi:dTDP-4-dehydrorhamnose reductase